MGTTPNTLAWMALAATPVLVLLFFASRRGGSLARTTAWAMVASIVLLPSAIEFKLPGLPAVDKHRASFLAIAIALEVFHGRPLAERIRSHGFARLVFVVLALGFVGTVKTNGDALVFGPTVLPALTPHEAVSNAARVFLDVYLPFAVGERVFRTPRDLRHLLEVLSLAAVALAPMILVELLMSPQLHRWVYGYHQHLFMQHVRGSGYRPMLFMSHGLAVAMFLFIGLLAAMALARARAPGVRSPWLRVGVIGALLLACRSLGAQLYGAAAVALEVLLSRRARARVIVLIVAFTVAYPIVRSADLLPRDEILQLFDRIDPARADSLRFRFDMEEQLLARAAERPVFGWGGWNRHQIVAPWGQVISIPDGTWIVLLGMTGYVGLMAFFALLALPLLRYALRREHVEGDPLVGTLALVLAFAMVDLLPNSRYDFLSVVFAGALYRVTARSGHRPAIHGTGPARAAASARREDWRERPPRAAMASAPRTNGPL